MSRERRNKRTIRGAILIIVFGLLATSLMGVSLRSAVSPKIVEENIRIQDSSSIAEVSFDFSEKLEEWRKESQDVKARITVPGTRIDYPVTHRPRDGKGVDYYLRRDLKGNYREGGTLFFDKKNKLGREGEVRDQNVIIYGHNMLDGTMFSDIERFRRKEFYFSNKEIELDFLTGEDGVYLKQKYEVLAVFLSKVFKKREKVFKYYQFYNSTDEADFKSKLENIKKLALYETEAMREVKNTDKFLTLSTCEYSQEDGRLVLMGKLVAEEKISKKEM